MSTYWKDFHPFLKGLFNHPSHMHVHPHIHAYTCTHTVMYTHKCAHTGTSTHTNMHGHTHTLTDIHRHTQAHMHAPAHTLAHTRWGKISYIMPWCVFSDKLIWYSLEASEWSSTCRQSLRQVAARTRWLTGIRDWGEWPNASVRAHPFSLAPWYAGGDNRKSVTHCFQGLASHSAPLQITCV